MTPARKPKPRPASTTTSARAMLLRGTTSPRPRVKKVVPLRYTSVQKPVLRPVMLRAEPEPYCMRAKLQTRPTAQTATRINKEMGPKIPKADSRAFLEGIRLASDFQRLQRFL